MLEVPVPGQPAAFLAVSEALLSQMSVTVLVVTLVSVVVLVLASLSAKTGRELATLNPNTLATSDKVNKMVLDNFMDLLFKSRFVNVFDKIGTITSFGVGVANNIGNEGGDNLGESDDGEADKGVENHAFGFLEFAGIARGGDVRDTTVNDENGRDDTSDADNPLDKVDDHLVSIDTGASGSTIVNIAGAADEGDTDGAHDDIGGHDDGEADEGVGESFFAGGDFAGISAREDIEITTVDNVADDEVSGEDGDVGKDVGDDGPDAGFERGLIGDGDSAVPGN